MDAGLPVTYHNTRNPAKADAVLLHCTRPPRHAAHVRSIGERLSLANGLLAWFCVATTTLDSLPSLPPAPPDIVSLRESGIISQTPYLLHPARRPLDCTSTKLPRTVARSPSLQRRRLLHRLTSRQYASSIMSNQNYYQSGPPPQQYQQYPPQALYEARAPRLMSCSLTSGHSQQQGYGQQQPMNYGAPQGQYYPPQGQYPPQQPVQQKSGGGGGCFKGCLLALCCCCAMEEGCECLEDCC